MAFLKMSVRKEVVRRVRTRPSRTMCVLCAERVGSRRVVRRRIRVGIPRA
jgi:hypothetical protein